jgi:hypothetical protein
MEFFKTFFGKLRSKPTKGIVVRKTDDEVLRYIKQTNLTKRRREFDREMGRLVREEQDELNTQQIRLKHYEDL